MKSLRLIAALCACALFLQACGGGGGGGGGGGTPAPTPGAFTLSETSASFTGLASISSLETRQFALNITGSNVAAVGAAYAQGQTPAGWLSINITGSGNSYLLQVGVNTGFMVAGDYTAAFTVGTANTNGEVLQTRVFTVTAHVDPRLEVNLSNIQRNFSDEK